MTVVLRIWPYRKILKILNVWNVSLLYSFELIDRILQLWPLIITFLFQQILLKKFHSNHMKNHWNIWTSDIDSCYITKQSEIYTYYFYVIWSNLQHPIICFGSFTHLEPCQQITSLTKPRIYNQICNCLKFSVIFNVDLLHLSAIKPNRVGKW